MAIVLVTNDDYWGFSVKIEKHLIEYIFIAIKSHCSEALVTNDDYWGFSVKIEKHLKEYIIIAIKSHCSVVLVTNEDYWGERSNEFRVLLNFTHLQHICF